MNQNLQGTQQAIFFKFIKIFHGHKMSQKLAFLEQFLNMLGNFNMFRNRSRNRPEISFASRAKRKFPSPASIMTTLKYIVRPNGRGKWQQASDLLFNEREGREQKWRVHWLQIPLKTRYFYQERRERGKIEHRD